ncbi:MAG: hypothetical protein ABII21_03530 [bacterium]
MIAYTTYMSSFIIAGGTLASRSEYIHHLLTPKIEHIHLVAEKSTLTIKQVHDLAGPLSTEARLPRLVWIEEANLLTFPAQNAILKLLEEPPANTDFYLTCESPSSLLPTIRSRTKLTSLQKKRPTLDPQVLQDLKGTMALSPGDRLAGMVKRDRAESILWITAIERALCDKFHNSNLTAANRKTLGRIARHAQDAHLQLESNCSVTLVTQNFLLNLPKTK